MRLPRLSLLDLTWGVRGVPEAVQPQPLRCRGCGETSWRCASCGESLGGWSSTNPSLMVVQGPNVHAVAREPGRSLKALHFTHIYLII